MSIDIRVTIISHDHIYSDLLDHIWSRTPVMHTVSKIGKYKLTDVDMCSLNHSEDVTDQVITMLYMYLYT